MTKWKEARLMAEEQTDAWEEFNASTDRALTSAWELLSTDPTKIGGRWTSVFLMTETPGR